MDTFKSKQKDVGNRNTTIADQRRKVKAIAKRQARRSLRQELRQEYTFRFNGH